MKKIIYTLLVVSLALVACDPVEDINNELAEGGNAVVGIDEITLTSDDYAALVEQGDDEEADFYETFEAFEDLDDAKNVLPSYLGELYPFWGEGSSVTVNFNIYDGNPENITAFVNADVYNLQSEDYITDLSNAFLTSEDFESELELILEDQFPSPEEGQVVRLGYNVFLDEPVDGVTNLYQAVFPNDYNNLELVSVSGPEELGWQEDAAYIVGSGFSGGANAVEEWIITPEIDLTEESNLFFQITQELDFLGDLSLFDILISTNYTTGEDVNDADWDALSFDKTAFGDMTTSEDFDFSVYEGETIHIALKYSSTDEESPRWRVESFSVKIPGLEGDRDARSSYYVYSEGEWDNVDDVYYLSVADYDSMGENSGEPGRFNNFSSSVLPANYLPQFLDLEYPFAQEGDEIFVIYRFFAGGDLGTVTRGNQYTFENGLWIENMSSLQFGFENGEWVPDNTIRYTLTGSDYDTIANELSEAYPNPTANLANFGNFDRRSGSGNFWSDDMVLEAINIILDIQDPSAEEGQKYIVTADTYTGTNIPEDFLVIKEDGVWVYQATE